ncbi:DUF6221 family protein [Isoptericola halotolerans]|uniref:Uncharacterized protein n=1 Tax=Isoptericola halotolerans TaxID=300560 RepID=A0ABX2A5R8_9MICO|nr:DUF6221 family protein [Isoptericola halotolerans]NOV98204.1 hypothetical protein [Isoptericola halotolerans]
MTIVEFLTARLDEDEAVARALIGSPLAGELMGAGVPLPRTPEGLRFMAYNLPQRVLIEVEAKRRIVALHSGDAAWCSWSQDANERHGDGPDCDTLRLLALPHADHPDYDEAWRL